MITGSDGWRQPVPTWQRRRDLMEYRQCALLATFHIIYSYLINFFNIYPGLSISVLVHALCSRDGINNLDPHGTKRALRPGGFKVHKWDPLRSRLVIHTLAGTNIKTKNIFSYVEWVVNQNRQKPIGHGGFRN